MRRLITMLAALPRAHPHARSPSGYRSLLRSCGLCKFFRQGRSARSHYTRNRRSYNGLLGSPFCQMKRASQPPFECYWFRNRSKQKGPLPFPKGTSGYRKGPVSTLGYWPVLIPSGLF